MSQMRGSPRVRALHAVPDAPAVDIWMDGSLAIRGLSFGTVSDYAPISAGKHSVMLFPSGMSQPGTEVLSGELEDVKAGQDYTLVATGQLSGVHAMVLDDTTSAPGRDQCKVRVVHASPDAPAVDLAVRGGPVLFKNVSFRQATPYKEVKAGMVNLEVRPTGSNNVVMSIPDYTLSSGSLYTFVALGLLKGTPSFMIMPLVEAIEMVPV